MASLQRQRQLPTQRQFTAVIRRPPIPVGQSNPQSLEAFHGQSPTRLVLGTHQQMRHCPHGRPPPIHHRHVKISKKKIMKKLKIKLTS
jgi:hypothetical protein